MSFKIQLKFISGLFMSETDENYAFNLSYFTTSEKHSQNDKKTFFSFSL